MALADWMSFPEGYGIGPGVCQKIKRSSASTPVSIFPGTWKAPGKASSLRYGLVFGGEWNHSLICICTSSGATRKGHLARLSSITAEIFPRSSRRLGDIIQRIAVKAHFSAVLSFSSCSFSLSGHHSHFAYTMFLC